VAGDVILSSKAVVISKVAITKVVVVEDDLTSMVAEVVEDVVVDTIIPIPLMSPQMNGPA
jgi:hypothetical protein